MRALGSRRMLHSGKLSKSKPFGIFIWRSPASFCLPSSAGGATMFARLTRLCSVLLFASVLTASSSVLAGNDGVIAVKSAYPIGETIERLKKDIADKGIKFFDQIDQSKLAADAGIKLRPSVLLIFGNPPLGTCT